MAKRAETRKPPVVDDADVQRIADQILTIPELKGSDAEIVKGAEVIARVVAIHYGGTTAWRRELVRKVRRRVEFGLMALRRQQP